MTGKLPYHIDLLWKKLVKKNTISIKLPCLRKRSNRAYLSGILSYPNSELAIYDYVMIGLI